MININNVLKEDYHKWQVKPYIYEKIDQEFKPILFGDFIRKVTSLAHYLINEGYQHKKIIIYGENSINWMIADLAITAYVGVSVTIDKESKEEDVRRFIQRLDVDAIFYSNKKKDIIDAIKKDYPIKYYSLDNIDDYLICSDDMFNFEDKDVDSVSKIVFSSGTTSMPKAVMLSLRNMFFGYDALQKRTPMNEHDKAYLFLPLHHTYAGIYNFLYSILSGIEIYLNRNLSEMASDFMMVKPTIFCGVPLIYERFYQATQDKVKLKYLFGPNMKYLFCGGALLNRDLRKFYREAGLNILVAYALSETASSFSIEYSGSTNLDSVGTLFEGMDAKIDNPDKDGIGEIVVKGDNVFLGYYDDPDLTKEVFDNDGYYHTGDLGYIIDNDLYYVKRKDKMICLANGENVSPKEIEDTFYKSYPFNKVKVFALDNILQAKFYVDGEIDIDKLVKEVNKSLSKHKKIRKYELIIDNLNKRFK